MGYVHGGFRRHTATGLHMKCGVTGSIPGWVVCGLLNKVFWHFCQRVRVSSSWTRMSHVHLRGCVCASDRVCLCIPALSMTRFCPTLKVSRTFGSRLRLDRVKHWTWAVRDIRAPVGDKNITLSSLECNPIEYVLGCQTCVMVCTN